MDSKNQESNRTSEKIENIRKQKSPPNYKMIYLGTLLLIAIIIGLIIYFLSDAIKLPSLNTRYETLYSQLEEGNNEIKICQSAIDQESSSFVNSTSNQAMLPIATSLISNLQECRLLLSERIKINKEISDIALDGSITSEAKKLISEDEKSIIQIDDEISKLKKQILLLEYTIISENVDKCFSSIDFNSANSQIVTKIDNCLNLFSTQESFFFKAKADKKISADFITKQSDVYYKTFRIRWDKSKELYRSLDSGNAAQSEQLRDLVNQLDSQMVIERLASDEEINKQLQ